MREVLLIELIRPRKRTMPRRGLCTFREEVLNGFGEVSNCASNGSSYILKVLLFGKLLVDAFCVGGRHHCGVRIEMVGLRWRVEAHPEDGPTHAFILYNNYKPSREGEK